MDDLLAFSIGVRMSEEECRRVMEEYLGMGWDYAPVYSSLAFVSPDGSILHAYDSGSGTLCAINLEWLEEARKKVVTVG